MNRGRGGFGFVRSGLGDRRPTCGNCGGLGHVAAVCWQRQANAARPTTSVQGNCACCGRVGHFRANCRQHQGNPSRRLSCCHPIQVRNRNVTSGPNSSVQARHQVQPTSLTLVRQSAGPLTGPGEMRNFFFPVSGQVGWTPVPAGATGTNITGWHRAVDITPAVIPSLSALVAEYEAVTFSVLSLEIVPVGDTNSARIFWASWISDATTMDTRVQDLAERVAVRANSTSTVVLEADFSRFSRHVLVARRNRSGARIRMWTNGVTDGQLEVRVMGVVRCQGRVAI